MQIAKARGAYVLGTARAEKHAFLAELGVDEAIDYTSENVAERARDVDVVLDLVGGETRARRVAGAPRRRRLRLGPVASQGSELLRARRRPRPRRPASSWSPIERVWRRSRSSLSAGALRPHVSHTFPLAEAARAHELGETGRTQGKLVLTVG